MISSPEAPILVPLLWDNASAFQNRILGVVQALWFLPPMDKHELQALEPIQELAIHRQGVGGVKRLSMMRIMARRTKATTVLA